MGNLLHRGSGSAVLEDLTERLTLAWSFQMVAFQISSEKQVCSTNKSSSTIRRPSRQVNVVPPTLLSLFHLLLEAGVDVCFSSCKRWRFDSPDSFINLPFLFWFHVPHLRANTPTSEAKYKNNNSMHLKFYFRTTCTAHTGIARSRGMIARGTENVRISNRGHRP